VADRNRGRAEIADIIAFLKTLNDGYSSEQNSASTVPH
jgi:hypothetical protein